MASSRRRRTLSARLATPGSIMWSLTDEGPTSSTGHIADAIGAAVGLICRRTSAGPTTLLKILHLLISFLDLLFILLSRLPLLLFLTSSLFRRERLYRCVLAGPVLSVALSLNK